MRILGVDPGTYQFGVGCIERHGQTFKMIFVEAIGAPKSKHLYERLGIIQERFMQLLDELKPEAMAIEDLFFQKNHRAAFHLGLSRGIAIAACLQKKIPIYEYPPATIKSVVTGHGRADKEQVKRMTEMQLGQKLEVSFDASDALAIALCHAVQRRLPDRGLS